MKEDSEIIVYTILYTTGRQPIGLQVILGALTFAGRKLQKALNELRVLDAGKTLCNV